MSRHDKLELPTDTVGAPMSFPIVDSHVHFWDQGMFDYSWLDGFDALAGPFLPDQLPAVVAGTSVENLVFVQADCTPGQAIAEVSWVTGLRDLDSRISGIVASAPLDEATVRPILDEYSTNPLVKGVRRNIQGEAPGFSKLLIRGVQALAERNLSFDICVFWHQLREVIDLVDAAPDVRFVLDHLGKPPIRSGEFQPWANDLSDLAKRPNVSAKLSGIVTEADLTSWQASDLRPYVQHAIEAFGTQRLMFGSDWPVATLATTYDDWLTTARYLAALDDAEEVAVFRSNALDFYRLVDGEM